MTYEFLPSLLVRTPLYSFQEYKQINYSTLLKEEKFQTALLLASKPFFDELRKKQFDFELLNEKQKHTIIKYANRASFRSTPFGMFSTFSFIDWSGDNESELTLSSEINPYIRLDFPILSKLWERFLRCGNINALKFKPNQSIYFSSTDIRYLKSDIDKNDQTLFSMVSVTKNPVLKKILTFCKKGKTPDEILVYLLKHEGIDIDMAKQFIRELVLEQVIVSDMQPNVTGEEYEHRLVNYMIAQANQQKIGMISHRLDSLRTNASSRTTELLEISTDIGSILPSDTEPKNYFYSVTEREVINGGLPSKYQDQIREGLNCLGLLCQSATPNELEQFKKTFISKYESAEVPLLEALDPQFGIGYGSFDEISDEYGFRDDQKDTGDGVVENETWKDLGSLLLNKWHLKNISPQEMEIEITDCDLKKLKENTKHAHPPGISVLFRIADENIFIEQAGGCSALALLGRFSCSPKVREFGKNIGALEQEANKNVVFAEIAHICNLHSANINRRQHLRDYEIPVLTHSTISHQNQIHLSDITISVENDTVLLRSNKLGKVIIPRLSSAYNYTKNVFPVFRFLCDVQYQNLHASLSFSLPSIVPGLKFYPRVRYGKCILQKAEWHFVEPDLYFLRYKTTGDCIEAFRQFAGLHNLPRYFAYVCHDNFLVFDLDRDDDLSFFFKEVRNKKSVILHEFPFVENKNSITNENHHALAAQYVAALYRPDEVYKPASSLVRPARASSPNETKDWLYFKIYCHPLSSDSILCDHIFPLIAKHKKNGNLKEWFWIRYKDPDYHIRLRMKPAKNKYGNIFEIFNSCLTKLCAINLVQRFQTDIYKQEIERYSSELIPVVEAAFHTSSILVSSFLKKKHSLQWDDDELLIRSTASVHEILNYFTVSKNEQAGFCKKQSEMFLREFGNPRSLKQKIELLYKRLDPKLQQRLGEKGNTPQHRSLQHNINTLVLNAKNNGVEKMQNQKLIADIIHMHVNRIFSYRQRYFEMTIYHLLYRSLTAEMHKQKLVISS